MRSLLLGCIGLLLLSIASATEQDGYILTKGNDSVKGKIEIELWKATVFAKKQLNLGAMETHIEFTEPGSKSRKMKAGDIIGFGFDYEGVWYHFVLLDMKNNTWKSNKGKELLVFLQREDGAVPIFKHHYEQKIMSSTTGRPGTAIASNLYIKTPDLGYVEVTPPNMSSHRKFKEFLLKYLTLEEDFMKNVSEKANFSDAEDILRTYNDWKKNNPGK